MKKLLSLLAAVTLTASASTTVVSCAADFSSVSISTDKYGNAFFETKVYIQAGQKINKEKDGNFKLVKPEFDLIKSTNKLDYQAEDKSAVTNLEVTIDQKYFKGILDSVWNSGTMAKDLTVIAKFSFHVDPEVKAYELPLMFVSLKNDKVWKNLKKISLSVQGTGAQPAFVSATYDGDKTITVNARDLDKIEGGFKEANLVYTPELPVANVSHTGTALTITLSEKLKQYKDNKTYTIEYKDNKLDLKASFTTQAVMLGSANLSSDGKSITISGVNLGTNNEVKDSLSSTGTPALDIESAKTSDNMLSISLKTPIVKDYESHNWTITYTLNSGDKLESKLSLAAKGEPMFSNAKYDVSKKTITINGTDFDNFPEGYKLDPAKFTLDGGTTAKGSEASINGNSITLVLDKAIEQYSSQKQYAVGYKDADKEIDIKPVNFNVEPTTLDGTAKYTDGGTTVTVSGHNLGNLGDVTSSVTIDGSASMKSASIAGDTLTITLNDAIDWTYEQQTFKINYKLTGGETLTSSFNVAGKDKPAFTNAKYDRDAKTVTITGSNLENFKDFDKSKFTIDSKAGVTITDAKDNKNNIVLTLDKPIVETKKQGSYLIKYTDDKLGLTPSVNVTVEPTSLRSNAIYTASTKTIEIGGTNLGKHDDVKDSVTVQVEGGAKVDVASASTVDNKLTVVLSKDFDKSYDKQTVDVIYKLNSGDTLDPAKFDMKAIDKPTFGTPAVYSDADKTITIPTNKIGNLLVDFNSKFLKITNDATKEDVSFASATVDGESIKVALNDRLKDYTTSQNYSISYGGDGKLPSPLTSSFSTKGINIDSTTYNDTDGTITITGKNFGNDRDVKDQIKIDGQVDNKDLVVASANITSGKLVIKLDKQIGQIAEDKTFKVNWNLTGGETLSGSFNIKGSNFTGDPKYDEKVDIKIDGSNLGNNTVHTDKIKVTGGKDDNIVVSGAVTKESSVKRFFSKFVKSEQKTDSYMDITLSSAIAKKYGDNRSFNIEYTLTSGEKLNTSFTMNGVKKPSFGQATYDQSNQTITINGDNLTKDYFLGYDQKNLTVEGQTIKDVLFNDPTGKTLQIVLSAPIKKYTTEKTYAIQYKDDSNGLDVPGKLIIPSTTLDLSSAKYDQDKTITVKGTNLGSNTDVIKEITGLDSSIKLAKASTTDDTLTLSLSESIAKKFKAQDFSFNYGLSGGETINNIKFTVDGDKALAPVLQEAKYDADKKEVTVTGINFDQIGWDGKFSIDNSGVTATKKSVLKNTIVLGLSNDIAEQDKAMTYQVKYTDTDFPDGISTTKGFDIKAKSVFTDAVLQSDNQTIKVTGNNFLTSDKTPATAGALKVKSTTVASDTEIDVVLDEPIKGVYWQSTDFKLSITNDGVAYSKDLSVAKNGLTPTFTSAEYNRENKSITIQGTNFNQVTWDKSKFGGLLDGAIVSDVKAEGTSLTLTLNKEITQTDEKQTGTVSYDDGHSTPLSATYTVNAKGSILNPKLLDDRQTITLDTKNLPDSDNVGAKITNDTTKSDVAVASSSIKNNVLTIKLEKAFPVSYEKDNNLTISVMDTINKVELTAHYVVEHEQKTVFTSATYDDTNLTVRIEATSLGALGTADVTKFTIDGTALDSSNKIIKQDAGSITIQLSKALKKTDAKRTVDVSYADGKGMNPQTTMEVFALIKMTDIKCNKEGTTITITSSNADQVNPDTLKDKKDWTVTGPKLNPGKKTADHPDPKDDPDYGKVVKGETVNYTPDQVSVSGNTITLTFNDNNTIAVPYRALEDEGKWDQIETGPLFSTYTDPGSKQVAKSPTIQISRDDKKAPGSFDSGESAKFNKCYSYDGDLQVITITGKNIENIVGWNNKSTWKIDTNYDIDGNNRPVDGDHFKPKQAEISEIRLDATNKLCLILSLTGDDLTWKNIIGGVSHATLTVTFTDSTGKVITWHPQQLN